MNLEFHSDDPGIATLHINRPQQRNALHWATQKALSTAITAVATTSIIQHGAELFAQLYAQPAHLEALQAVSEKRPPLFNQSGA